MSRLAASVRVANGTVALVAPAKFAPKKLGAAELNQLRQSVLSKLERSLLFEQLNAHNRRLVFRSAPLRPGDDAKKVSINGKEITVPQKYPGVPSINDVLVAVNTSRTQAELRKVLDFVTQSLEHDRIRPNLRPEHVRALLRRSAELGDFTHVFWALTMDRNRFERLIGPYFYLEALRIYALRVPFLNHNSKNMLYRLHMRSPVTPGRDLCLTYALAAYQEKFGPKSATRLPEIVDRAVAALTKASKSPKVDPLDASIGLAAAEKLGTEQGSKLADAIKSLDPLYAAGPESSAVVFKIADPERISTDSEGTDASTNETKDQTATTTSDQNTSQ